MLRNLNSYRSNSKFTIPRDVVDEFVTQLENIGLEVYRR